MGVCRRHLIASIGALLLLCARQAPACAGTWSSPVSGCVTILGYGEQYAGRTHRGVDLAATAGSEVGAPAAGTVVFAGSVPADGGGTCVAVTVQLSDGLRVSLLPLDKATVAEGDTVVSGDAIGMLALSGDDSSSPAHLHLGLRRGDTYLDPTAYLPTGPVQEERPGAGIAHVATPGMAGDVVAGAASTGAAGMSPAGAAPPSAAASAHLGALTASASDTLADVPGAGPATASPAVSSRAGRGGSAFESAGLPVPSAIDPSHSRAHVRGRSASVHFPPAAPSGTVLLLIVGVTAAGLLVPWRVATARAD